MRAVGDHFDAVRVRHVGDLGTGMVWPTQLIMCVTWISFVRGVMACS